MTHRVLAVADVELAVYVDPLTECRGSYQIQSRSIQADPRRASSGLIDHLSKRRAKEQRRSSR